MIAEAGVDLAYAIAKSPELRKAVQASRNAVSLARELGKIEARLASAPPAPKPSSAPPPPRTLTGAASGAQRDPSKMSMAEYAAWRNGG
jgi:hypothetical protein